jgi:hypothetical protein
LRDATQYSERNRSPADGVISNPTSKPLIVVAFDQSTLSAQGLPSDEFTRRFTSPTFADVGKVNGELKGAILGLTLPKREEAKSKQTEMKRRFI